eukprot:TRINITY_DN18235_c0_g1_i1.p1 TRINITY_DN18235_c0_g1~~TRINITY_DN18235_c0_g1_i1.p1  ORF type:complete len:541 (-),score=74.84 TRINITY_DN18235_c0_g1_i1:160-1569(-)
MKDILGMGHLAWEPSVSGRLRNEEAEPVVVISAAALPPAIGGADVGARGKPSNDPDSGDNGARAASAASALAVAMAAVRDSTCESGSSADDAPVKVFTPREPHRAVAKAGRSSSSRPHGKAAIVQDGHFWTPGGFGGGGGGCGGGYGGGSSTPSRPARAKSRPAESTATATPKTRGSSRPTLASHSIRTPPPRAKGPPSRPSSAASFHEAKTPPPPRSSGKQNLLASPTSSSGGCSRPRSAPVTPKLSSARFDSMRVAPAFSSGSSIFAQEYSRGNPPCRIDHGTRTNRISWDVSLEELTRRREELLLICAEGLRETRHPYATVARLAFTDLIGLAAVEQPLSEDANRRILTSLRLALLHDDAPAPAGMPPSPVPKAGAKATRGGAGGGAGGSDSVFEGALTALRQLARAEGPRLAPNIHLVLPPIAKRMHTKANKDAIRETLEELESFGGPSVVKSMRSRGVFSGALS